MPNKRDISPILQKLRDLLMRRKNLNFLRFQDEISARSQPPPKLPDGPHAKLSGNYYYTRDARRLVTKDEVLAEGSSTLKIGDGSQKTSPVLRTPGKCYSWD